MNRQVRKLTEGAMMCALFGIVLLINRQFAGVLELFFVYVLPLPLIVYTVKHDVKSGCICAISISFLSLMISTVSSMVYSIMAVVIGLVYGALCHRKVSNGFLIGCTMLLTMVLEIMCCLVFASVFGYDLIADARTIMEAAELAAETFGVVLPDVIGINFFLMLAVLAVVLAGILEGVLVHLLASAIMKHLKIEVPSIQPISAWEIPKWIGHLCAIVFVLSYVAQLLPVSEAVLLGAVAAGTVGSLVLVFFGYVACLMMGMVKYKKNLTLILIVLFIFIWPMYAVLGYFYIVSDSFKQEILRREDDHE